MKSSETIIEKIKLGYIVLQRFVLRITFLIPMKKNRVIFESFSGDGYNCNPKYISQSLIKKYGNRIEVVWALKDEKLLPEGALFTRYRSLDHLIKRITSKVYVCNFLQAVEIPKRKGQVEIQTWHGGGCYKKVGSEEKARGGAYIIRRKLHVNETDYFIASSKFFEDRVIRKQLAYKGNVLSIGMPRNDCLFGKLDKNRINEIRDRAGIDRDVYAVLYAPTWREGLDKYDALDYELIAQAFSKRFNKKALMIFRAHLYGKEKAENVLDLTSYPDMQELLYACDALITDYSSSMWDFSITGKPCLLYTPDLDRYIEQRGFDKDIYSWGFPVCKTNSQMYETIIGFNEKEFILLMDKHQKDLGSYEKGNATEQVVGLIASLCGIEASR